MNKVLKRLNLKGYETKVFPAKLCTVPGRTTEEPGVLESRKQFLCVIVDRRFDSMVRISLLRPYTWTGDPLDDEDTPLSAVGRSKTLYGWVDDNNNLVDHKTRRIHNDYDHVVAWRPA